MEGVSGETVIVYVHVLWRSLMEGVWGETVIVYIHVLWRSLLEGMWGETVIVYVHVTGDHCWRESGEKQSLCMFM